LILGRPRWRVNDTRLDGEGKKGRGKKRFGELPRGPRGGSGVGGMRGGGEVKVCGKMLGSKAWEDDHGKGNTFFWLGWVNCPDFS